MAQLEINSADAGIVFSMSGSDDDLARFAVGVQESFEERGGIWLNLMVDDRPAVQWVPSTAGIVIKFDGDEMPEMAKQLSPRMPG